MASTDAIGLVALFGSYEWTASGMLRNTKDTKQRMEALIVGGKCQAGVNCALLLNEIPKSVENTFEIEGRSQRGFKFEWKDTDGMAWHVHGHEPDAGAKKGHIGGQTWVVRIQCGEDYLLSAPHVSGFPQGHKNYFEPKQWSDSNSNAVSRKSHIEIDETKGDGKS